MSATLPHSALLTRRHGIRPWAKCVSFHPVSSLQLSLVELEPQPDDEQVYGSAALVLITEWRQQLTVVTEHWPSVEGYVAEVGTVELEIELISQHGLTMPPADIPWRDWQRKRELQRRHARLGEARRKLRRKRLRRFIVRLLTLGLLG